MWSYAKGHVYADKPLALKHLKTDIRQVTAEIPPNMYQKLVENYLKRTNACNASHGDHLNDVVFRTYCQRLNFTIKKTYHEKKFYFCVLFTFTFENTK